MMPTYESSPFAFQINEAEPDIGDVRQVVWGWRRSTWDETRSRLVLFKGQFVECPMGYALINPRLIIRHTGMSSAIHAVALKVKGATVDLGHSNDLTLTLGTVNSSDFGDLAKLDKTSRNKVLNYSHFRESVNWRDLLRLHGKQSPKLIIYAGSGLSYESGLPSLSTMHQIFGVDNGPGTEFNLGDNDPLIDRLVATSFADLVNELRSLHIMFVTGNPSDSHDLLYEAFRAGRVEAFITDNVDEILERAMGVKVHRTRGDGLLSEPYAAIPDLIETVKAAPHVLLVIGVSADRRSIIGSLEQFVPVVVINPAQPVSPHSKNLDYLVTLGLDSEGRSTRGNVFIKQQAKSVLSEVLVALHGYV